jgi:nitroimidazol reductase NimA-like FMN-containing flavoprotein (pyridoxamine 5'-phosphate oxidase superfamily)
MSGETSPDVQNLEHHGCWAMLRTVSVGRLAVMADGRPDIFPINYTVDGGTLVFRTGEGTKLAGASKSAPVALEADGVDPDSGLAWSVVAKGTSDVVSGTEQGDGHRPAAPLPLAGGKRDAFVRIMPDRLTRRRFKVTGPLTWWTQPSGPTKASPE